MTRLRAGFTVAVTLAVLCSSAALAQRDLSKVEIKPHKLTDTITMLQGAGGNIGVCAGPDGVLLIDDQFAELTPKIQAAVKALSEQPIRFVFNTHFHGDHVGGNENLGKAGAVIVAHDNVRRRMSAEQFNATFNARTPPSPPGALPIVTFSQTITFHVNGEQIRAQHLEHAHTDGDVVLFFEKSNVVHMGDCFFNGNYPIIDVSGGGSIDGMIAAADHVLGKIDDGTRVIPGHGPLADKKALQAYRDMLVGARAAVKRLVDAGKSRTDVLVAKPTAEWDAVWGKGFMKPELFVGTLVDDLSRPKPN